MATAESSELDGEELLHLALKDIASGQHDSALIKLKKAVVLNPKNAKAHFLLAAEHAEIGMFERAAEEFQSAIDLDPNLYMARFQLGLTHFTLGDYTAAKQAWAPLDSSGDESVRLFKDGLLLVSQGNLEQAKELLERAVASDNASAPLLTDIRRVLKNVTERLDPKSTPDARPAEDAVSSVLARKYDDSSFAGTDS